jgi:hypothetical protein
MSDPLWCLWTSRTHCAVSQDRRPRLALLPDHCAAVFGMARGASTPDAKTRALFDQAIDYYDEHEEYEL